MAAFMDDTIAMMDAVTRRGFAFNCLTSFSDAESYAGAALLCRSLRYVPALQESYSRNVALLHDYELYEFTIIVRKIDVP